MHFCAFRSFLFPSPVYLLIIFPSSLSLSPPTGFSVVGAVNDSHPIRAIAFDPFGDRFAVGSNSKTLRVCSTHCRFSLSLLSHVFDLHLHFFQKLFPCRLTRSFTPTALYFEPSIHSDRLSFQDVECSCFAGNP